jgi:hypothetical protein
MSDPTDTHEDQVKKFQALLQQLAKTLGEQDRARGDNDSKVFSDIDSLLHDAVSELKSVMQIRKSLLEKQQQYHIKRDVEIFHDAHEQSVEEVAKKPDKGFLDRVLGR